jgi:putative iron-regulated protein
MALNEQGGEANIATGFHAIEFLLWGQDLDADGPGQRPYTDYVTDGDDAGPNAERRGKYLSVVADLLVEQLSQVRDAWKADKKGNFRSEFESADPDKSLGELMTGMHTLSGFETGGERLQAALTSADQNDEHSCFSDNTHRDMVQDVQGVLNIWTGRYETLAGKTLAGPGVGALVEAQDPELFEVLDKQIKSSLAKAKALKAPFDNEIAEDNSEGRDRVRALIQALNAQAKSLDRARETLGLEFVFEE